VEKPAPVVEKPVVKQEMPADVKIVVRRARPSDVPSVLLLIHRATNGVVRMKRAQLLMSMAERSYFIGQMGADVVAVMGYTVDSGLAQIDQIFMYPLENAGIIGPPLLAELQKSAIQHICEGLLAYPEESVDPAVMATLTDFGLKTADIGDLSRAWQAGVKETQPDGTILMAKMLRDIRIA
jgi:N-acetylglutamate synthase-like GNAT family acetyltransferase